MNAVMGRLIGGCVREKNDGVVNNGSGRDTG